MTAREVADEFPTFTLYRDAEVWIDAHNPFDAESPDEFERVLALQQEIAFWDYQEARLDARAAAMRRHPSTRGHGVLAGMTPAERAALTTPDPIPARSLLARRIASAASSVLLCGGVFLGVLVVGGYFPRLAGPTVLCALCMGGGVFICWYIERAAKESR